MNGPILYALGTLLVWIGVFAAARAMFLLFKGEVRHAVVAAAVSGLSLLPGGQIVGGKGVQIPLVWVVMPFSAWAVALSLAFAVTRLSQAAGGLNPDEQRGRLKAALLWGIAAGVFAYLYRIDREARIDLLKGGIPLSVPTAAALVVLAMAAIAAMELTAKGARSRGYAKIAVTHLTLIAGSILFGLPLAWLVITSFKEDIDMASPSGIVWVPKVQETVPYFSKTNPLYATRYESTDVEGRIMSKHPDGTVTLDVNKPMSLRGMTVEAPFAQLKEVPRQAPIVTVALGGDKATGKVIDNLDDGHVKVEIIAPAGLKGRQQIFAPSEVQPVRKVGLRTQNYSDALDFLPVEARRGLTYFQNTLFIVILGVIGTILSSAAVAYGFSRLRFPGRDVLFTVMLSTMMLPGAVTKLPQFMIFKSLGWIDTLYPLWVPTFFGSALSIFMLRQFFRQVPVELEEAAKIDGAGYLRSFWSVMMPQVKPALAVIAILTFVGTWNNFLDPLIYINSPEKMTISYAVQLYAADRASEPGLITAFTTLSMLPVLALFFFAQRYFIEGVTLSGMGGR